MISPLQLDAYDVIICGGGTAGCVLASRLGEDPDLTVLILEAGEDANDDPRVTTPGLVTLLYSDRDRDWQFPTEPSLGLNGRTMPHPRGKCIGGSSAINLMNISYPSRATFDAWASLGNPDWDWNGIGCYYQKFQRQGRPSKQIQEALSLDYLDAELENTSGPIASSHPSFVDPIPKAWVDTWKRLNRAIAGDPLGGEFTGGYTNSVSVDPNTGERSHAGLEYYKAAAGRPNLHLLTQTMIEKVELDDSKPDNIKATGVTFIHNQRRHSIQARKEVILCAGVFGSPCILERSGIGSKFRCEELGIKHYVDNPNVGENLQDHLACGISYEVKDGVVTADMSRDPVMMQQAMEEYQSSKTGPLAGGGVHAFAYTPLLDMLTPVSEAELRDSLDRHLPQSPHSPSNRERKHQAFVRSIIESPNEASASMFMINVQMHGGALETKDKLAISEPENYVSLMQQLAHPLSRGSVHIKSADPDVYPKIDPNYLSHPLDAEVLARHMMQCETFATTAPFSDLLKLGGARLPRGKDALTLEKAIGLVRSSATSNYHPCDSCAMMPEQLGGVVDSRLRVHGVKGLRVCDASIFPIQVRGNIMSTVYAVAEKGCDILKEDLRLQQ